MFLTRLVKFHTSDHFRSIMRKNNFFMFKNFNESLYIYGDMEYGDVDKWEIAREDVVLQRSLKSGTFAELSIATLRSSNREVVAKMLKGLFRKIRVLKSVLLNMLHERALFECTQISKKIVLRHVLNDFISRPHKYALILTCLTFIHLCFRWVYY